jgi:polysaccharide pyruvyl transferase WcaK-like protein
MTEQAPEAAERSQVAERPERVPARASGRRAPRIGFISWAGAENLGNDGCLEAMLNFVRRNFPDAPLLSISPGPELVEEMFGVPGAPLRWLPKRGLLRTLDLLMLRIPSEIINWGISKKTVRRLDYLIYTGMSVVDDYRTSTIEKPLTLRRWLTTAKAQGVKILYVSVGADRVRNPISRWIILPIVRLADYRSYRDEGSKAYLLGIGADAGDPPVYPDLAWSLPTPPDKPRAEGGPLTVGVGVMAYHGWRNIKAGRRVYEPYVAKITEFVDWLASQGHRVRLLVGEKSDRRVVATVTERARAAGGPLWMDSTPANNLHELMAQISETDIVIASRFHNIVCALKMGRPTFSLGYMSKCTELLDLVGTPGYSQMIEDFDVELLKRQFNDMLANRKRLEATIRESVVRIGERMAEQERRLLSQVFAG